MTAPRKQLLLAAISAAVLAAPAAAAQAATYYVSPAGSDANSGSSASSPWQSLAKVNATRLSPGDQLLFQGGQTFTGELDANGSGAPGNPVVYSSYGVGKATLVQPPSAVNLWLESQHDVTVSNLIFDGASRQTCVASSHGGAGVTNLVFDSVEVKNCGSVSTGGIGIHQTNIAQDGNWTVRNSYVHGTSDSGIILEGTASADTIVGNRLDYVGTASGSYGFNAHGIYSKNPGVQILNNDIGHYGTEGISTRFRNALIQANRIHDGLGLGGGSEGVGFYSYDPVGAGTTTIRDNRFDRPGENAVYVSGPRSAGSPYNEPENWRITNNLVVGAHGSPIYFDSDWNGSQLVISNNTFVGVAALHIGRIPRTYVESHNNGSSQTGTGSFTSVPDTSTAGVKSPRFVRVPVRVSQRALPASKRAARKLSRGAHRHSSRRGHRRHHRASRKHHRARTPAR